MNNNKPMSFSFKKNNCIWDKQLPVRNQTKLQNNFFLTSEFANNNFFVD